MTILDLPKQYIFDEHHRFLRCKFQSKKFLENFSLAKLMQEVDNDNLISKDNFHLYYKLWTIQID